MSDIVKLILSKDYEGAKGLIEQRVKDLNFVTFRKKEVDEDAQLVPGNPVTSVDLPGSPPETDGDVVGAGEGVPTDFEGKGAAEKEGRGASGPSAAGDDPGSTELDSGGRSEQDADYGPAVVTEKEKKDDDGDDEGMDDDVKDDGADDDDKDKDKDKGKD